MKDFYVEYPLDPPYRFAVTPIGKEGSPYLQKHLAIAMIKASPVFSRITLGMFGEIGGDGELHLMNKGAIRITKTTAELIQDADDLENLPPIVDEDSIPTWPQIIEENRRSHLDEDINNDLRTSEQELWVYCHDGKYMLITKKQNEEDN